jgi:hypothetical protein
MKVTAPPTEAVPSLHQILERTRMATCGHCWNEPGIPCAIGPDGAHGHHVARLSRAMRKGLITGQELVGVLQDLAVFDSATLVYDVPAAVL